MAITVFRNRTSCLESGSVLAVSGASNSICYQIEASQQRSVLLLLSHSFLEEEISLTQWLFGKDTGGGRQMKMSLRCAPPSTPAESGWNEAGVVIEWFAFTKEDQCA